MCRRGGAIEPLTCGGMADRSAAFDRVRDSGTREPSSTVPAPGDRRDHPPTTRTRAFATVAKRSARKRHLRLLAFRWALVLTLLSSGRRVRLRSLSSPLPSWASRGLGHAAATAYDSRSCQEVGDASQLP